MDSSVTKKPTHATLAHLNAKNAQEPLTTVSNVLLQELTHQSVNAQQEPSITVVSVSVATINVPLVKTERDVSTVLKEEETLHKVLAQMVPSMVVMVNVFLAHQNARSVPDQTIA
jgi:hypothetical protein